MTTPQPASRTYGRCVRSAARAFAATVSVSAAALVFAGIAQAEVRGLIIGIDDYPGLEAEGVRANLKGAVNDARDIAQSLAKAGSTDITVLVNGRANRDTIEASWKALVERASPGDTLIFSYAGHGSQEPEPAGRNGEEDGMNENFILGDFKVRAPFNRERIIDDEINEWLKMADNKGIRVVFLADSCHSGTMYRSLGVPKVRFRQVEIPDITDDELTMPSPESAKATPESFRNVTFIGATEEHRKVPEIPINGKPRGAMSYSFSRALEGGADTNKDGTITQEELISFLLPSVTKLVESQQKPQVLPTRAGGTPLIEGAKKIVVEPAPEIGADILRVAIVGGDAALLQGVADIAVVTDSTLADIVWDVRKGTVEHNPGGLVAENVSGSAIFTILAKWSAIKWLETHAKGKPGEFILHSGNQRYKPGDKIKLSFKGAERPYLTLFNLAPNGRVEFFVAPREVQKNWIGKNEVWEFTPKDPPFGAEHLMAIFTDQPLVHLHDALKTMSTADRAVILRKVLVQMLGKHNYQVGKASIYTGLGG